MKKLFIIGFVLAAFSFETSAQDEQYGPYVGGNGFLYKSNLYNSHDASTDSVQLYKLTMGFGAGFDFGYKYQNGFSVSSGIWFGTNNQNYASNDTIFGDVLDFSAKTTMSFIKIPLIFSMQTRSDKALKAFYNLGLYYSLNTGFSETINWNYKYAPDVTTTIKKQTIETTYEKDTNKYISTVDQRPYKKHGWGAILGLGASKRFNKNAEWYCQLKIEYQISSSENNDEMVFSPKAGSIDTKRVGHVWGNYAKYMHTKGGNYNRPATHPFNLGINFGIRYYLFDFE